MQKLINWEPGRKQFFYIENRKHNLTKEKFQTLLKTKKRPQEIEDFVEALTKMWNRLNVACGKCFAGKIDSWASRTGHGCCGHCPSLGETACVAKPVGCALYTCGTTQFTGEASHKADPYVHNRLGQLRMLQSIAFASGLMSGYFADGYLHECIREWTPAELEAAKRLTTLTESVY